MVFTFEFWCRFLISLTDPSAARGCIQICASFTHSHSHNRYLVILVRTAAISNQPSEAYTDLPVSVWWWEGPTRFARHGTTSSIGSLSFSIVRPWKPSARTLPSLLSCTVLWQRMAAMRPLCDLLILTCPHSLRPTSPKQISWLLPTAPVYFNGCIVVSNSAVL